MFMVFCKWRVNFQTLIGERRAVTILPVLTDAEFRRATDVERARLPKRLKEPVQKDLRLSPFIAGDALADPRNEGMKFLSVSHAHVVTKHTSGVGKLCAAWGGNNSLGARDREGVGPW